MADGAHNFLIIARQLTTYCKFKNAFEMYLCLFNQHPETRHAYEAEFYEVLRRLNENLDAAGREADIFDNFEKAVGVFPASVKILNDIGAHLSRHGYYAEALCHFEKALNIDPCFVSVEKNLNSAKSWVFPRCHFRSLNDKIRNDAYRRAIEGCVTVTDSVINIDSGTGLLAMYAAARGPPASTACEVPNNMAQLSECIMQDNNAQVTVIKEQVAIMHRTDARGSRSVLLIDLFDPGLLGYGILHTMCDAWETLLNSRGRIIPGSAEYFVVGVKCDQLLKEYQLCAETKRMLNVSNINVHRASRGECYCGEDVHLYKDLKYMTEPESLFKINFHQYHDMCGYLDKQVPYTAALKVAEDGEINAVVGFFDLNLTEDITVTSDPRSEGRANAWQQAVFFDFLPRKVKKNDEINISFTVSDLGLLTEPDADVQITRVSVKALKFLNDTEYMKIIAECLGTVCIYLGQMIDLSYVDIVDLSPFPTFGLLMMMRGANSLVCHATTPQDKAFVRTALRANNIPYDKVTILVGTYWSEKVFKNKKFHIIFKHMLDYTGDIDMGMKRILDNLVNAHLYDNGLTLPARVSLMGQLVSSTWLEINNRVADENVHGFKLAARVNGYQVSQVLSLNFSRLGYTPISEEFVVATNCEDIKSGAIKVPVATDGVVNAVLSWYNIQLLENGSYTGTKRSDSCVSGMAFMTSCEPVFFGDEVNVLRCVDSDGSFKCVADVEP